MYRIRGPLELGDRLVEALELLSLDLGAVPNRKTPAQAPRRGRASAGERAGR